MPLKFSFYQEIKKKLYNFATFFLNIHLGYPFNFFLSFCVTRAYLRLAEVKWVKTGVPGVKPLLGLIYWFTIVTEERNNTK